MVNCQSLRFLMLLSLGCGAAAALNGCTVHPNGEQNERRVAMQAGESFRATPAPLPENPSAEDLVRYALMRNGDLEQKYWAWRSSIEQIPQDGTQMTNLALSANVGITRGLTSMADTTLSAGNDPMADLVLPPQLSVAARRALEEARAAGIRFRKAQFECRAKVLSAWSDYVLNVELIRLGRERAELLKTVAAIAEARNRVGSAGQEDLLRARNEVDLAGNEIAVLESQIPAQRAAINALLNREAGASLPESPVMPAALKMELSDSALLSLAAKRNPELEAVIHELAARNESITLARLQYLPEFSINAGSDLTGVAQSVLGTVTVPFLRHEAIDAAIAQAESNLHAAEAMHRQLSGDVAAQVVSDINTMRDADRQLELFQTTIVPRLEQIAALSRTSYETGQARLTDFLESRRSLIASRELVARLRAAREKRSAELEAILAQSFWS